MLGLPFGVRGSGFCLVLDVVIPLFDDTAVKPLIRRRLPDAVVGLLLRVLALPSRLESVFSPSSAFSSSIGGGDLTPCIDRVVGPKYSSLASALSEGGGVGEVTRGVPGVLYCCDMVAT